MQKLLIIDFFNLMHRAFHAYPKDFKNSKGEYTGAAYGLFVMLLTYIKKIEPTHLLIAFEDDEVPTFRSTAFSGYKANRTWAEEHKEEAEIFATQIPLALKILEAFGFTVLNVPGYEADDIIGTVACKVNKGVHIVILSNDQDLLQLVTNNINVLRPARPPFVKEKLFTPEEVYETYGFAPIQMVDYKGLRADPSDNIPGVKGIGEVGAKNLIKEFGTIEEIYKNISKIKSKKTQMLLANNAEEAVLCKKLATIECEVPVQVNLDEYKINLKDKTGVIKIFEDLEFKSLIKKMEDVFPNPKEDETENSNSLFNY